ncbi:uncharacterized protein PG986_008230 [Apiospora aurea]|uniref:Zn(2)-C6 fungal-type domain-containing protein n=1 Tax=Apiospora aurea TaxID=335848 RepID=A0ABR1QF57_9PEZI
MDSRALQQRKTGPRACLTCAKAKARCIPCNNPLKCERCDRLKKQCVKQTPAPPKARRDAKTLARVAESRSAPVVVSPPRKAECLSAQRTRPCGARIPHGMLVMFPEDASPESVSPEDGASPEWPEFAGDATSQSDEGARATGPSAWPQGEEGERLLNEYRTNTMHLFPFVIVPPYMSAAQLRSERPVLWKAVMLQACFLEGKRQVYMGRKLLQELSEALLTKPRKGLDVLQGLLLYIGWFHYALSTFQVTNLLGLARSLCTSLGFNENKTEMGPHEYGSEQLDQMRAFAGTYYLSTYTFLTSKRPDALGNTAYLQVVSRIIGAKAEYPTDTMLVHMLEIQQIAHSISLAFVDGSNSLMSPKFSTLPLIMIVKGFQAQIENFRSRLPVGFLEENAVLMAHVQVAEILLYEVGMHEGLCEAGNLSCMDRIELLWTLHSTCKSFLTLRLQSTPHFEPRFLCIASYDFMYGFITCLKLTNLNEVPGWDTEHVRRDLRLEELIEQLTGQMQSMIARREKGGFHYWSPEEDPYRRLIDLLHGLKGLLATVAPTPAKHPPPSQPQRPQQRLQQNVRQEEEQGMGNISQIPTPPAQDIVQDSMFDESFGVEAVATEEDMGSSDVMQTWEEAWSDMVFSVDDWGQSTSFCPRSSSALWLPAKLKGN